MGHTCTKDVLVLVHVLLYLYVLLYPVNQSGTTKYKLYRIFRFFATKTARIRSTVKVKITKFIQPIWFKKIGVFLSWMLSKNMPQNWKIFFTLSQKSFHGHFCQKTARNHLKTLVLWPKSWKTVVLEFVPEKYWRVLLVLYFVPEKNRRSTSTWYFCTWNENRFEVQPWLSYGQNGSFSGSKLELPTRNLNKKNLKSVPGTF